MYEVTTITKNLLTTDNKAEALKVAEDAFKTSNYVEVKEIITLSPWYTRSVKIFHR